MSMMYNFSNNSAIHSARRWWLKALLCGGMLGLTFGITAHFAYADTIISNNLQLQTLYNSASIMSQPGTDDKIGQVGKGSILQAIAKDSNNWYEVSLDGVTGWVGGWLVQVYQPPIPRSSAPVTAGSGATDVAANNTQGASDGMQTAVDNGLQLQVLGSTVNVRSGPGTSYQVIGQVHSGDTLEAETSNSNDWYQIDFQGQTGWIAGWLVQDTQQVTASASRGLSPDIISAAERFLGAPYQYGGNGPYSFDCSGFTRYVYSRFGIELPRVAADQARVGQSVSSPAPGDLVFFSVDGSDSITHVGIYIGNNSFISADNQGVSIALLSDPWWSEEYVGARQVV
jgi:cell wall-associated NlpC family hydrolase